MPTPETAQPDLENASVSELLNMLPAVQTVGRVAYWAVTRFSEIPRHRTDYYDPPTAGEPGMEIAV